MKFSLKQKTPETKRADAIVVAGKVVGRVEYDGEAMAGVRCHAILDLRLCGLTSFSQVGGLAQGHADTAEAAIADALAKGRRDAESYLSALTTLAAQMGAA
jgi:hypothetical protein